MVNRSTTVHLSCFYPQTHGRPKWVSLLAPHTLEGNLTFKETTSTYRSYPHAWAKVTSGEFADLDAYQVLVS